MSDSTLISLRLPTDIVQRLDSESALLTRPDKKVTRTDVIATAVRRYFGDEETPAAQEGLLDTEAQKPYKCPGVGCNMRSSSKAATCPTHGRRVVPV